MQNQLKNLPLSIIFWLMTEVVLNLVGLDTIADYSEFIFVQKDVLTTSHSFQLTAISPPSCRWMIGLHSAFDQVID